MLLRRYGWPPNSPDLNPVDYAIWGALQERVYHGRKFENVEQLKQAILLEWRALSQRFIDCSINQWRRRLQGVVQENGGHIEHVVQLAVDICTLGLLFVTDVIRDELYAGVQHMIFFQVVCLRQSC